MRHGIAAATVVALSALAPAAFADTISFSTTTSRSGPDFDLTAPASIPLFDTSLGTLVRERITISGDIAPGFEWFGTLPPGSTFPAEIPVTFTPKIGLVHSDITALPSESTFATIDGSVITDVTGFSYATYIAMAKPEIFSLTFPVPTADLNSPFDGIWAFSDFQSPGLPPGRMPDGLRDGVDMSALGATLLITYTYAPAHPRRVPEPATLPLLAIGLAGLLGVVRRSRPGGGT